MLALCLVIGSCLAGVVHAVRFADCSALGAAAGDFSFGSFPYDAVQLVCWYCAPGGSVQGLLLRRLQSRIQVRKIAEHASERSLVTIMRSGLAMHLFVSSKRKLHPSLLLHSWPENRSKVDKYL